MSVDRWVYSTRVSGEEAASILGVLGDEYARKIIKETSDRPMSAKELTQTLNISQPTISRRLRTLTDLGLVSEESHLEPGGHHYSVYQATLKEITVRVEDEDFVVRIEDGDTPADRLSYLLKEMRRK